jgi:predicted O-methyltransferase YrrM
MMQFILDESRQYYVFEFIEKERNKLLHDYTIFRKTDFGAGSKNFNTSQNQVSKIAKTSLSGEWQCQVMFRIAEFLKAESILEMGTSFGISTMYLAGNQNRKVTALEGDPKCVEIVNSLAAILNFHNLEVLPGPFSNTIPHIIERNKKFDLIFMDGHHMEQPTIAYFNQLQTVTKENSVILIDDIHWSAGMNNAWRHIQNLPVVTQTIDFYYFGIVFLKNSFLEKQHHRIIPLKYKPWKR